MHIVTTDASHIVACMQKILPSDVFVPAIVKSLGNGDFCVCPSCVSFFAPKNNIQFQVDFSPRTLITLPQQKRLDSVEELCLSS